MAERRLALAALGAPIGKFPERQRVPIALVCIDRFKVVAEISRGPMGRVMSRIARARRELHARPYAPPAEAGHGASQSRVVQ